MRTLSIRAALLALVMLVMSAASFGQVRISVTFGPPALPVYEQPLCPGDGYIWTPGYWAWSGDDDDYYWVPGTWVQAPEVGYLWTPPYWAWADGAFVFYEGYWGQQVGFYGGINYGFGYFGEGFEGGRWDRDRFYYNRAVTNVNVTNIHNVYNETVINNTTVVNRVSYNGGNGGVSARPTPRDEAAARERHMPPASAQVQQMQTARGNPELRASANHGKPPVAATVRPAAFSGREAVPAREAGAPYNPPANRGSANRAPDNRPPDNRNAAQPRPDNGGRPATPIHPNELPPRERPASSNTGNPKFDQKYQQQQEKLQQKQDQERQKLQQQQEREHQQLAQQKANDAQKQQVEQKHQQQTQQLQERHQQQQQKLQQKEQPRPSRPEPKKPQ